jgi:hypothetical protein
LGRKNNKDGPPLKEYRKLLLDQLCRNMGSLGLRPTGEQDDENTDDADDKDSYNGDDNHENHA